jgi:putative endonuclease
VIAPAARQSGETTPRYVAAPGVEAPGVEAPGVAAPGVAAPTTTYVGQCAERAAARFLEQRGLATIARNYRTRFGEIDLVMRDGDAIVFVEVRYRGESSRLTGAESITAKKRKRVVLAARAFLGAHPRLRERPCRFDVVAVARPHYRLRYEWIRGAFMP